MPFDSETGREAGRRSRRAARDRNTQWETLAASIVGEHADRFNTIMREWANEDATPADKQRFADNYQKILKYFKPALQTSSFDVGGDDMELTISIKGKADDSGKD